MDLFRNQSTSVKRAKNMCGYGVAEMIECTQTSAPQLRLTYVRFNDGAFTKWHRHTGEQLLVATEGVGFVELANGTTQSLLVGSPVYIPKGTWHRHGAVADTFTHLAITSGSTVWHKADVCKRDVRGFDGDPAPVEKEAESATKEFLLEEYRSLTDSLWKNEQTGETRVNWYIGIVGAVAGGLISLSGADKSPTGVQLQLLVIGALFALLVFGTVTLFRMLKRDATTDGFKKDLKAIREIFKTHFDGDRVMHNYFPFGPPPSANGKDAASAGRKFGGLVHTVIAINSLLIAAMCGLGAYAARNLLTATLPQLGVVGWTMLIATVMFGLAFAFQKMLAGERDRGVNGSMEEQATHAGGVVYRISNGVVEYLLVGPSKEKRDEWLLPKGHIESLEAPDEAALREVAEETGVIARLIAPLDAIEFTVGKKIVHAQFFLMESVTEEEPAEQRRIGWFAFPDAVENATHDETKSLLMVAERMRAAMSE